MAVPPSVNGFRKTLPVTPHLSRGHLVTRRPLDIHASRTEAAFAFGAVAATALLGVSARDRPRYASGTRARLLGPASLTGQRRRRLVVRERSPRSPRRNVFEIALHALGTCGGFGGHGAPSSTKISDWNVDSPTRGPEPGDRSCTSWRDVPRSVDDRGNRSGLEAS